MTAMHLFRTVLVALSSPKTFTPGLFMQRQAPGGSPGATQPPEAKAWRRVFEVVFVDGSGWLNLAAAVSKAALAQARGAAARSLLLLNAGTPEGFAAVFLARQRRAALYDYWFHVWVPPQQAAAAEEGHGAANGTGSGGGSTAQELQHDQPSWRWVGGCNCLLPGGLATANCTYSAWQGYHMPHASPVLELAACRSIEQRVERLASKALGNRALLVRVFRRTLASHDAQPGSGKAAYRKGAARPQQQHVLLGVQVGGRCLVACHVFSRTCMHPLHTALAHQ